MNPENLRALKPGEEAREVGRKGGIASAKARKKRKEWQQQAAALLEMRLHDPQAINPKTGQPYGNCKAITGVKQLSDFKNLNSDAGSAVLIALLQNAMKGDRLSAITLFQMGGAFAYDPAAEAAAMAQERDDGFIAALSGTAADDWEGDPNAEPKEGADKGADKAAEEVTDNAED